MYRVLRTILGSKDKELYTTVKSFYEKTHVWMPKTIQESFAYVLRFYDEIGMFPTMDKYNEVLHQRELFVGQEPLASQAELACHLKLREVDLCHNYQYMQAMTYLGNVARDGLKTEVIEALRGLAEINTEKEEVKPFKYLEYSKERKAKGTGYRIYLNELEFERDPDTGEKQLRFTAIEKGLITVIAGFTGQYKTTLALNSALKIIMDGGNVFYFSLEVPKKDILLNLYALYSMTKKGQSLLKEHLTDEDLTVREANDILYKGLSVRKLRGCLYGEKVERFLDQVLEPEFNKDILSHLFICDETDIQNDFSELNIRSRLIQADDQCRAFKGTKSLSGSDFSDTLDLVYVDHVGLTKFYRNLTERLNYTNVGDTVNMYASMFRRICVNFRTILNSEGVYEQRQLAGVLLAQINREGWKYATRSKQANANTFEDDKGTYDLTCLAEANELEKGSAVVITVYTDDNLRSSQQAKVQCLKCRFGSPVTTPVKIMALPEYYLIGGIDGMETSPMDLTQSREDAHSLYDNFNGMVNALNEGLFSIDNSLCDDALLN